MALINTQNFFLVTSMSDLVSWIGDGDETCVANPDISDALELLGVKVNLVDLSNRFFECIPVGKGDVYLFLSKSNEVNAFAIDLYRGMTDQMDIVSIGIRCREELVPNISSPIRSFFDSASCQVRYEQACYSESLNELIDSKRYPRIIEETRYEQQLVVEHG